MSITTTTGQIEVYDGSSYLNVPIDIRYGPWESLDDANDIICEVHGNQFYGLTIGIYRYDQQSHIIGIDEYWWQPNAVLKDGAYHDGFVLKYPANNMNTVSGSADTPKVLGLGDSESDLNAAWKDDSGGSDVNWNMLEPEQMTRDTSEVIEQEEP